MGVNIRINRGHHEERIFEEILNLSYCSESLTDLIFICEDGNRRYAHQSILSRVSPFIASLNSNGERICITLEGINVYILDYLLRFLYTGEVTISDSLKIKSLSQLCESLEISLANTIKLPIQSISLYCLCRQPEKGRMIGCDFCDEWYHPKCINISRSQINDLKKRAWKCPLCLNSCGSPKPKLFENHTGASSSSACNSEDECNPTARPSGKLPKKIFSLSREDKETLSKPLSRKRKWSNSFSLENEKSAEKLAHVEESVEQLISPDKTQLNELVSSEAAQAAELLLDDFDLYSSHEVTDFSEELNNRGCDTINIVLDDQSTPGSETQSLFRTSVCKNAVIIQESESLKDLSVDPKLNCQYKSSLENEDSTTHGVIDFEEKGSTVEKVQEPVVSQVSLQGKGVSDIQLLDDLENNHSKGMDQMNEDFIHESTKKISDDHVPKPAPKSRRESADENLSFCYACLSIFVSKKALREHELQHHM